MIELRDCLQKLIDQQIGAVRVLGVFLDQQVHGFLRDRNLADRCFGFGPGDDNVPVSVAGDMDNGILAL